MAEAEIDLSNATKSEEKLDHVKWDYGHLVKECNRCGHKEIMDKDVEGGISLYLPVASNKELKLNCEKCNTAVSMYFIKSDKVKPPEEPDSVPKGELVIEEKKTKRRRRPVVSDSDDEDSSPAVVTTEEVRQLARVPTTESDARHMAATELASILAQSDDSGTSSSDSDSESD